MSEDELGLNLTPDSITPETQTDLMSSEDPGSLTPLPAFEGLSLQLRQLQTNAKQNTPNTPSSDNNTNSDAWEALMNIEILPGQTLKSVGLSPIAKTDTPVEEEQTPTEDAQEDSEGISEFELESQRVLEEMIKLQEEKIREVERFNNDLLNNLSDKL